MYARSAYTQVGDFMADDDAGLLDRVNVNLQRMEGLEQALPAGPQQCSPKPMASGFASNTRPTRKCGGITFRLLPVILTSSSSMVPAGIAIHVEPVVKHFASDGLTREGYFKAVAAEPRLLLQKPDVVISNIEKVMDHYAADKPMRTEYLQAAVRQPELFGMTAEVAIGAIQAEADKREAPERAHPAAEVYHPVLYQPRLRGLARSS